MTGTFSTEADVMVATAGHVDTTNNQVQSELHRLRGVVDSVQGNWKGVAQTNFDSLMERWTVAAQNLRDALTSIAENIRHNAHSFEGMDMENADSLRTIGGQGLPL
ncbi:WXG100 family type VII secretion target [Corynebacterium freiburgense]|uniref:WXG100 family type VII secretion target n=1 Tax=Corynebacterium freiburgense TaxID=556548 RepID=UPI00040F4C4F|nr:WXG100 family type VII secretion target [Corynebacterium freiburgense]WJZ01706.1 WXG domain conatining protein [Corynebacterium freiburgense]